MRKLLTLPHRVCKSTCYSNGLEDILEWKGKKYIHYLLPVLGGMGEFAYLRFKIATPPNMVYWGANTKYLMQDIEKIIGLKQELTENKAFKGTFAKIKNSLDNDQPVVAGALDMYYLHYYPEIYLKKHIPIHYILLTGYDDDKQEVYVYDCGQEEPQKVSYADFEKAFNVNVPGMSKKNTIRTFTFPDKLPSELELAKKGLSFRADKMLNPPVKLFGIPAMRKLAKEIFDWKDRASFEHLVIYATTPPELPATLEKSSGMRVWKSEVLKELGKKYKVDLWLKVASLFEQSGKLVMNICQSALEQNRQKISATLLTLADIEEQAYKMLKD